MGGDLLFQGDDALPGFARPAVSRLREAAVISVPVIRSRSSARSLDLALMKLSELSLREQRSPAELLELQAQFAARSRRPFPSGPRR